MRHFFIAGLALALSGLSACTETPIEPTEPAADARIESAHFTVSVTGSGPDVILVPGLASSAAVWDATVAALSDTYTLHAIQVGGFAGAAPRGNADNETILDDLAADLVAYANELEQPPALVGHSLGGLVTLKAALNSSADFERIVVIDVLPFFSVLMDDAATAETMTPIAAFMKASLLGQSDEIFAARQAEALSALVKSETDLQSALEWSLTSDRAVMAQAMSEVLVTDLREDISAITIPTTVIYARDPAISNMDNVEAFYQDLYAPLPNGALIAIDDALHFVMLDQPETFLGGLETALSR
ncbi:MAG: alpha/beta fold hydrolase [Henriciella sp.]